MQENETRKSSEEVIENPQSEILVEKNDKNLNSNQDRENVFKTLIKDLLKKFQVD